MVQERLTLRKIKEILSLKHEAGLSNRAIARACKISNSTYLRRAKVAGIGWPVTETDEDALYQQLFPEKETTVEKVRPLPEWEAVRKEMRQKAVTLRLVWMEYFKRILMGINTPNIVNTGTWLTFPVSGLTSAIFRPP
jgi:hypothetical protein